MATHRAESTIPALVAAELYSGAPASCRVEEHLAKLEQSWRLVPILTFDLATARRFGELKAGLRRRGKPTGKTDAWIAAMALAHAAGLVTHNTGDRENSPELRLESWLTSDAESR